jgi:hypothetical protein
MKKFSILLLIIFLISSCSNDDSVIFEFEKEIVKSKHCLMVYDLNYNETYDCTNSVDTMFDINATFNVNGKKTTFFFPLHSQNEYKEFQNQYRNAMSSINDFYFDKITDWDWSIDKFVRDGEQIILISNRELNEHLELKQKDWKTLINPKWKIKYFSDIFYSDSIQKRKEITKEEFLRLKL